MNELMTKDNEWIIHFMGSLDRLLDNYERLTANYRPTNLYKFILFHLRFKF